jgi:hypothetical protein
MKIQLEYKNSPPIVLQVRNISTKHHILDMSKIKLDNRPALIHLKHEKASSLLDFTHAESCMGLYFDNNKVFNGTFIHIQQGAFIQSVQDKLILISSFPEVIQIKELKSFKEVK